MAAKRGSPALWFHGGAVARGQPINRNAGPSTGGQELDRCVSVPESTDEKITCAERFTETFDP